jgi:uncharacterized membrane protein YadS
VVLFFALKHRNDADAPARDATRFELTRYVPWFIVGFLLLAVLRSAGVISPSVAGTMKTASTWLTVAAMAGLGLGVDLKTLGKIGRPVMMTVTASLVVLVVLGVSLIRVLAIR